MRQIAARQETLDSTDPKDLRVPPANAGKLLLPEKHTSHNRKNDGYQPMDCSAKKAREHILALVECYAAGRLNVRDTFSR